MKVILTETMQFLFRVGMQHYLFPNKISLGSPRFQDHVDPRMSLHSPFLFQTGRIIHIRRWTSLLADTEHAMRPKSLLSHPSEITHRIPFASK